jgi:Ca2+-binding RTX toxin-like protein
MAPTADFVVNSSPLGTTYSPFASTIAVLPDGTALVAWVTKNSEDPFDTEITARWLNADGTPAGGDFVVNSTTSELQWRPVATVTAEGKVFLAWESGDGSDGDGLGLRGVVLDPLSQTPGPDFLINPFAVGEGIYNGQNNQSQVALTALSDGRVFAVWTSFDGSDGDSFAIRARYFADDGTALGDDFLINTTAVGGQYEPQATELSDGRILVTYGSTDDADGTPGNIRARIIGTDGVFAGDDFVVNSTPGGYQSYVDVTTLADGNALVVWFSSGVFTPDPEGGNPSFAPGEVRARIIGADGQPLGSDFQVNSTDLSSAYTKPVATTLADGRVLVAWHSGDAGDGDWGSVRGRLIEADGGVIESDFVINTTGVNNQSSPAVAALPDGRALVTWNSDDAATGAQTRGIYLNPIIGHANSEQLLGTAGQDLVMGLDGNDSIFGGSGDDQLMAGTGNDLLTGGTGNDWIDGGTGSDSASFTGTVAVTINLGRTTAQDTGHGTDTILNVEHVTSGSGNDRLTGNALGNSLISGDGNDILNGAAGNDTLTGGLGNDVYVVSGADVIVELAAGGTDTVETGDTFSLVALAQVENLTLTGTGNFNAAGNAANNVLTGNSGNNILNGNAGADTMAGGAGNDIYYVDVAGDMTTEFAGGGTDLVSSSVSRKLGANIENLNLSGVSNINGSGNTLANIINGNTGQNHLRGFEGADTLNGGTGSDTLQGGTASDRLNPGSDTTEDVIRFSAVADSTGSLRDIVTGMDLNNEDRFDFPAIPMSLAFVNTGTLNLATINANLATAVDAALAANGAVLFDPTAGDLDAAGHSFLVVDANGDGVYKPNQDYVVQLVNFTGTLTLDDFT